MKHIVHTMIAVAALLAAVPSCRKDDKGKLPEDNPDPVQEDTTVIIVPNTEATVWTTTGNKSKLFEEGRISFKPSGAGDEFTVNLKPETTFQEMDGFGAAMTGASCYNLLLMSAEDRSAILNELFNTETGLGISLIRVSIGSSDFSVNEDFTWCDTPGMENFGIPKEDELYLFPVLHEIYDINPDVKIIGSPWTCPLWMKRMSETDDSDFQWSGDPDVSTWAGGSLKPSYYNDYADYFVKWINAMENEGFNIYAVTIQNEPFNRYNTASVYMSAKEQRNFIKNALGPTFLKEGIKTKIICLDHNYNCYTTPMSIFADKETSQYVAGTAWHDYGGKVSDIDNVNNAAPDKEVYFTEASIGSWGYSFMSDTAIDFRDIFMETIKRGCKGITLWNMALDENHNPHRHHGCYNCLGVITISSNDHKVKERNSQYYDIAHASKVVKPGAVRIGTEGYAPTGVQYQAFRNPDGSFAVIMVNSKLTKTNYTLVFDDGVHSVECEIGSATLMSLLWKD